MLDSPFISPRRTPRRPNGVRRLRWIGSALLLGGAFVLGWDIYAGFTRGTRWHLALTCLSDILPSPPHYSMAPPWARLIEGVLEFAALTPLALFLCGLGWCALILSPGAPGPERAVSQAPQEPEALERREERAGRALLRGESDRGPRPRARPRG